MKFPLPIDFALSEWYGNNDNRQIPPYLIFICILVANQRGITVPSIAALSQLYKNASQFVKNTVLNERNI